MPKAGTGGCWLELPLSTDRFATEDHCTKDECRSPHLASRLMIPHCVAPRCATDTYLGCIPAKRPDRTYGAGPQPCSTGALLDMAPCACDSGSHEGRRHIWGRCAGPRCKVEMTPSYECIRSCDGGPRHRHVRPLRAGRRPPPRDPHMAAFPADSTSACTGCRAFLSSLEITLGLQPPMRYHGARTRPSAYWSSAGDCSLVPRFAGSAGLVSPRDASNDVPSIFGKRSERQARSPRDHVSAERRPVGYLEPSGLGRMPDRVEESTPSDQVARCREAQ